MRVAPGWAGARPGACRPADALMPPTLPLLALAAGLAACGPGRPAEPPPAPPGAGTGVTPPAADSLELRLGAPDQVPFGAPVRFTFRVRNPTAREVALYLLGREPTLDLEVSRAGGAPAWRRLEGEVIPAILRVRILAPGERLEVSVAWDQRTAAGSAADPGDYVAVGRLLVEGGALAAPPVPFRIAPP